MPHIKRRVSVGSRLGLAVVVGLIAGCTSDSPAASTRVATSEPMASAAASEAPSESPSATPTPAASESAAATIPADADLAALLPTMLGGGSVMVAQFTGDDFSNLPSTEFGTSGLDPIGSPDFGGGIMALAEELDVLPADVEGAMAYAPDHEPSSAERSVVAIRVVGADPAAMVDALGPAIGGVQFRAGQVVATEETVGGKTVSVMEFSSYSTYFYAIGDVAFLVKTADPDEAETVLQELP